MKITACFRLQTIFRALCLALLVNLAACGSEGGLLRPAEPVAPTATTATPGTPLTVSRQQLQTEEKDLWRMLQASFRLAEYDNAQAREMEDFYLKRPQTLRRILNNAKLYLPFVMAELQLRGLPGELALIPIVESYYDPRARADRGHAGLWQLSAKTAHSLHLLQNEWIDERYDAIASTRAALNYLLYLHRRFADWRLAIAAYNWGEGSLGQSLQKAHHTWRGRSAEMPTDPIAAIELPTITRNYLARIQALKNLLGEPQRFNLDLPPASTTSPLKRIRVPRALTLQEAARLSGISLQQIRAWNPAYLQQQVIQRKDEHNLLLPHAEADLLLHQLHASAAADTPPTQTTAAAVIPSPRLHIVRAGETLGSIALRHQTSVKALRLANALPPRMLQLKIGQKLKIPDSGQRTATAAPQAKARTEPRPQPKEYIVRRGDTLGGIAARHKISLRALRRANGLSAKSSRLKIGQKLTLPTSARSSSSAAKSSAKKSPPRSYRVRRGDTLGGIAARHKISLRALRRANGLSAKSSRLKIGQKLTLPTSARSSSSAAKSSAKKSPPRSYRVRRGDTLGGIAARHKISLRALRRANGLSAKSSRLKIGQKLKIPSRSR